MSYRLVEPEDFTEDQQSFIEDFSQTVEVASSNSNIIMSTKDIRSCHLVASDAYARIVGLSRGKDVGGRMDRDMPREGTAAFADCYVREDRRRRFSTEWSNVEPRSAPPRPQGRCHQSPFAPLAPENRSRRR